MDPRFSSSDLNLPFGYKFDPTAHELLQHYLIPKLKGEKLPSDYVMDLDDVCKYEPRQLPFNELKHAKKNEAYFFTMDSRKDSVEVEGSKIRTTPNGYWKVYKDKVPIEDIGLKTKLVFHGVHGNKTDWKMLPMSPYSNPY